MKYLNFAVTYNKPQQINHKCSEGRDKYNKLLMLIYPQNWFMISYTNQNQNKTNSKCKPLFKTTSNNKQKYRFRPYSQKYLILNACNVNTAPMMTSHKHLRASGFGRRDGLGLGAAVGVVGQAAAVVLVGAAPHGAREAVVPVAILVRPAGAVVDAHRATLSYNTQWNRDFNSYAFNPVIRFTIGKIMSHHIYLVQIH